MIIKGQKANRKKADWTFPALLVLSLIGLLGLRLAVDTPQNTPDTLTSTVLYCSAETKNGTVFIEDGHEIGGGETQSSEYARTGKYASRVDSNQLLGFSYRLENLKPGDLYKVEVWKYTKKPAKSILGIRAKNKSDFFQETHKDVETEGTWWFRMEQVFRVPTNKEIDFLLIYTRMEKGDGIVLFDDLKITKLDSSKLVFSNFTPLDYHVKIEKPEEEKLNSIKKRSFAEGILVKTEDDFVKADVTTNNGINRGKVRLKGDWLDHIFKGKSSFRVQLKSTDNWQGMQVFSLQSPETRGMLREWVYHQFLGMADVLSPRYDFVHFHYNEEKPMVYAYEEHFTKNLVENQLRREGPILKFTEDRFWEGMSRSLRTSRVMAGAENKNRAFWKAQIKPFKEKKTLANPNLKSAFEIAQNLLKQYQYGTATVAEVFDIHRLAKYMAITDILQATHALTWHNQRFYFNPVTNLLEPIGFDGFGSTAQKNPEAQLHGELVYQKNAIHTEPVDRIFYDPAFVSLYLTYLNEYSSRAFINKFRAELDEPITAREQFLKTAYPKYSYNRDHLMARSNKIQERLFPFENSIQAFSQPKGKDSLVLQLINTHSLPLEIIAIGQSKSTKNQSLASSIWVYPSPEGTLPDYSTITVSSKATTITYRMPGTEALYYSSIAAWSAPGTQPPRQALLERLASSDQPYTLAGDLILFEAKEYVIDYPLVLPKDKKVVFEPGAHLKFKGGGFLISFSAVDLRGDEESPIIIESLDKASGAFVVMQAGQRSTVRHAVFQNQNTVSYNGWNLTGGLTFYESPVTILATRFLSNQCEDALNIVRSDFELSNSLFRDVFGDAFDADFCKGTVSHCGFERIGNDALDFSTSKISITNCTMREVGDKAISAGEHATIEASQIEVEKSNIAFASKDLSVLTLNDVSITSSSKGFTAYQKKPEYGPATIHLKEYSLKDVKYPFLIEDKSVLNKSN